MITYVHSDIFPVIINTACGQSKRSTKKKILSICQSCWFWRDAQVLGYGILKKMVQGKDTLNNNQSLTCQSWWHGLLLFLHKFLRFVLLLLLHYSGKIAIPHYHMFLLIQILHLVLFKLLQRQGELSISGDIHVVFWWARYVNCRLSFLKRSDLPFVRNGSVAIYFWPIFVRRFRKFILLVMQQCGDDCVFISGRWTPFNILGCAIDLVDGAQYRCKRKQWFMFYAFLWTCQVTDYFQISSVGNCLPCTCRGHWRRGRWRESCQLGRCTNQRWGAQVQTQQQDVLVHWFIGIPKFFPDTPFFYD